MKHIKLFEGTWKEMQDKKFARRDLADHIEDSLIDNLADCLQEIFDEYHIPEDNDSKIFSGPKTVIHWSARENYIIIDCIKGDGLANKIEKSISKIELLISKRIFRGIDIEKRISYTMDAEDTRFSISVFNIKIIPRRFIIFEEFNLYNKDTLEKLESISAYLQDIFMEYKIGSKEETNGPYWTTIQPKYNGKDSYGSICINLSKAPHLLKQVTQKLESIKFDIEERLGLPIEIKTHGGNSHSIFINVKNDYKKWIKNLL